MSDEDHEHQTPIKTPKQLITVVVAAFIVPIVVITLLVNFADFAPKTGAGSEGMSAQATAARIAPVAKVEFAQASASNTSKSGEEVFKSVCSVCHGQGIAGAPKFGDAAAWAPRIQEGVNTLWDHALKGFQGKSGVMPPKGGNSTLSDVEVERGVVYMANAAGAKFQDPPVPAAAATPTPAASAAPAKPAAPVAPPNLVAAIAAANASASQTAQAGANTDPGQKLFQGVCIACHGQGVAGAPKFGNKAAWAPRIQEGLDTLYQHALHGFQGKSGTMPPKGGSNASDDDVKAAVRYMVNAAK